MEMGTVGCLITVTGLSYLFVLFLLITAYNTQLGCSWYHFRYKAEKVQGKTCCQNLVHLYILNKKN